MRRLIALLSLLALAACGGGAGSTTTNPGNNTGGTNPPPATGGVYAKPALVALTAAEVQAVVARAVAEAQARNKPANIAVVDRVGNVLAVYKMTGAPNTISIPGVSGRGLQRFQVNGQDVIPATAAAIAKAITGAYLSSSGNAFSTRTASEIVQTPFPPAPNANGLESGPLYGVQFSQLPCSDFNTRMVASMSDPTAFLGPKRSPLGFAADPGGFPLYKNGVVVGGVGVESDGVYTLDPNITDDDKPDDEIIAWAGTKTLDSDPGIRADKITVDGTSLIFTNVGDGDLKSQPSATVPASGSGSLVTVNGYFAGTAYLPGTAYGSEASGYRAVTSSEFSNPDAYTLTNGSGALRYPIRGGTDSNPITAAEARAILSGAFQVLNRARAQIRQPLNSRMEASVTVVDTNGAVLGFVRTPDAPIFGSDVALQKARTALFFTAPTAASDLQNASQPAGAVVSRAQLASYATRAQAFFNDPAAFTGKVAFSERAIGNISRNRFPDGQLNASPGPLAAANSAGDPFTAFNTGVQLDAVLDNIVQHVVFILGGGPDTPQQCTNFPNTPIGTKKVANGFQIFSGGVPLYRNGQLVGAIGVSGDGIDQDDMVAFLGGANNGGQSAGTGIGNAPTTIRSDQVVVPVGTSSIRLRYVNCPFSPFLDTAEQNVCQGL
jgi:uncharacterized protein GlcG (DUF336 family)